MLVVKLTINFNLCLKSIELLVCLGWRITAKISLVLLGGWSQVGDPILRRCFGKRFWGRRLVLLILILVVVSAPLQSHYQIGSGSYLWFLLVIIRFKGELH
jgi:hypothetical protein